MSTATSNTDPVGDAHQLALRLGGQLVVQAAQDAASRPRVVVLHELDLDPGGGAERLAVVALQEEAALVAEDARLEQQYVRDRELSHLHGRAVFLE